MKTSNNLDFTNAVQDGINEFHRLSGCKIKNSIEESSIAQNKKYKKMESTSKPIWKLLSLIKLFTK